MRHASDDVCDVKDELHVHGGLGDAGAASMDDRDQSAVQLVHVALGEELASAAGLVLNLQVWENTFLLMNLDNIFQKESHQLLYFLPYPLVWRCVETAC